jgi:metal transporter CNNM
VQHYIQVRCAAELRSRPGAASAVVQCAVWDDGHRARARCVYASSSVGCIFLRPSLKDARRRDSMDDGMIGDVVTNSSNATGCCACPDDDGDFLKAFSQQWFIFAGCALGCITTAALAAGLTMGMVGLDPFHLSVIMQAEMDDTSCSDSRRTLASKKKAASSLIDLVSRHHWLLVTLLLCNAAANEALPLFLDQLVPSWLAVTLSVTFVLLFGEIIPSALFTGPSQMLVSSYFVKPVWLLMFTLAPLGWPIAKILDLVFGEEHVEGYMRAEIKAIVGMHRSGEDDTAHGTGAQSKAAHMLRLGGLTDDEVTIMQGVFECGSLRARDCMVPFSSPNLYMLEAAAVLDEHLMADILASGHSRVPVYKGQRRNVIGLLLVKRLIPVNPADKRRVGEFVFRAPIVIAPETSLLDCLNMFQKRRTHMALVSSQVDALSAILASQSSMTLHSERPDLMPPDIAIEGLLTVEDVMEKLIQEDIEDETDSSIAKTISEISPRLRRLRELAQRAQMLSSATNRMRSTKATLGRTRSNTGEASLATSLMGDHEARLDTSASVNY